MSTAVAPRARWRRLPARSLIWLVQLYRVWISPITPPSCRFTPTCSEYAVEALAQRGAVVGLALTVARVAKCAPWHAGGWDPVPERRGERRTQGHDESTSTTPQDELRSE